MRTRALLRRMRWDMTVCFILTMLCIVGISELDNKIGFFKKGFDAMEEAVSSDQSTSIPNGEIGGFATEDTPRIEPEEEALRKTDETFTMEVKSVKFLNRGSVTGNEYSWYMMELENGKLVAMRINFDKIQDAEGRNFNNSILPVGKCVHDTNCEAYDLIRENYSDCEVIDDFYIDMDGDAGYSKALPKGATMGILVAIEILVPILAMVLLVGLTLLFHMIGCKLGIFPPIFRKKQEQEQ